MWDLSCSACGYAHSPLPSVWQGPHPSGRCSPPASLCLPSASALPATLPLSSCTSLHSTGQLQDVHCRCQYQAKILLGCTQIGLLTMLCGAVLLLMAVQHLQASMQHVALAACGLGLNSPSTPLFFKCCTSSSLRLAWRWLHVAPGPCWQLPRKRTVI